VPDWQVLGQLAEEGWGERPTRLSEWQQQFGKIYQTFQGQQYDYVFARLSEELGELAEAVRVFKSNPYYFISEAADVFAWLMKLQNLFEFKTKVDPTDRGIALEERLATEYPGYCTKCWGTRCHCPPLLPSTVGRTAKDVKGLAPEQMYLPVDELNHRFGQ
jgi:NTP pyrophosphatase (non-canonical NTP hydrolase)